MNIGQYVNEMNGGYVQGIAVTELRPDLLPPPRITVQAADYRITDTDDVVVFYDPYATATFVLPRATGGGRKITICNAARRVVTVVGFDNNDLIIGRNSQRLFANCSATLLDRAPGAWSLV